MTMNLHQVATCNNELSFGDFHDDAFLAMDDETIARRDVVVLLQCDVVPDDNSELSKLTVHCVTSESDGVDDDDTGSVSSLSCSFCSCYRIPSIPSTSICVDDPTGDFSFKSSRFSHPLSQCIENESTLLTRNSPVFFESSKKSMYEPTAPVASRATKKGSYSMLRMAYLLVTLVIMLADGLQGTHLYVLYEGYGYSVAYLYCLGFATGGLLSPITGPMVDKIGRKKSAILYCCLEMLINHLEQFPNLYGLILCRMVGGFTTNLLSSVFETWLDTEYRRRGFAKEKYEIIMRDSVIVSNSAAIFSGYLSHILARQYGTVGPFQGAVTCTTIALIVVCFVWTENYGVSEDGLSKNMMEYFQEAVTAFRDDGKMLIIGILQSLTVGSVQIFVFLWAPTLRHFARGAPNDTWGLDHDGEPAYGLIFCAFMAAGVLGGFVSPHLRTLITTILSPIVDNNAHIATVEIEGEGKVSIRPMAVEFLAASCYFISALLLFVPSVCQDDNKLSFTTTLLSLVVYEFMIGIFTPCEGVIRSLYFPVMGRASIMTLPRIIVNAAVAVGVLSTSFISLKTAFFAVGCLMTISSALQISLISGREWSSLSSRFELIQSQLIGKAQSLAASLSDTSTLYFHRQMSDVSDICLVGDRRTQPEMTLWDTLHSNLKED